MDQVRTVAAESCATRAASLPWAAVLSIKKILQFANLYAGGGQGEPKMSSPALLQEVRVEPPPAWAQAAACGPAPPGHAGCVVHTGSGWGQPRADTGTLLALPGGLVFPQHFWWNLRSKTQIDAYLSL